MSYLPGMISYVLFDPEARELLGGYVQVPPPEHVHRIEVSDEVRVSWPLYRLNADMTGVELIPWWEEQPEEPPVDPEPSDPVQSGN